MCYEVKTEDEAMQKLKEKYQDRFYGAKVIQVIEEKCVMGEGTDVNPYRVVTLYRSLDGDLLAAHDPEIKSLD